MDYISCVSRPSGQGNLLRRLCACRFPSFGNGGYYEEKPVAYGFGSSRDSLMHRKCLCLECFDKTCHGRNGSVSFRGDMGFFNCDFIFRNVCRIFGRFCREDRSEIFRLYFCLLFWDRHDRNGTCRFIEIPLFTLFVLRLSGRYRSGNRLYHTRIRSGEMVS